MTHLYQEVSTNYSESEDKLLEQYKIIKTLSDMEITSKCPDTTDINNLIHYIESLLSGKNNISFPKRHLETNVESFTLLNSLLSGSAPQHKLSIQKVSSDNEYSSETHYAPLLDMSYLNLNKVKERFQDYDNDFLLPDDPLDQLYLASLGVLGLFILYRLMKKSK